MVRDRIERWASPQRILVATNLEDELILSCEAASQARESGGKIILVHVIEPSFPRAQARPSRESATPVSRRGAAWNALLHMARMIEWEGAACEPVLLEGDPVEQITGLAERRRVDRVIVATRSARGLDRLLTGSVAESLMGAMDLPVCVVGPHAANNPFRGARQGQILLPLSLNHNRSDCVEFASCLAGRGESALTLMHVLNLAGLEEEEKEMSRGVAHSSIVALLSRIEGPIPRFSIELREGAPAHEILQDNPCPGWDFIVMGSSSPGIVSQFLGSSVVYQVIAGASCPVMTVRRSSEEAQRGKLDGAAIRFPEEQEIFTHAASR